MKIDLGCGNNKKEGYYGIDVVKTKDSDMVCDLNKGINLDDNSVDEVYSRHFLEHIEDPLLLFKEIYRVLKPNCKAYIIVPHWSWWGSYTFMHKRFFHSRDFCFFEKDNPYHYYTNDEFAFKIESIKLAYCTLTEKNTFNRTWNRFFTWLININHCFSENFLLKTIHADEIRLVLRKC